MVESSEKTVYLFHLSLISFTSTNKFVLLKNVLKHVNFQAVGVNVGQDLTKLINDLDLHPPNGSLKPNSIDLKTMVDNREWRGSRTLSKLTEKILGYQLPKDESIRRSDWSKSINANQREYAARDAVASILLYEKILTIEYFSSVSDSQSTVTTRVLLDPFHAMKRIKVPRNHSSAWIFYQKLRDHMFEINEEDKAAVTAYLVTTGTTFEKKMESCPEWILQRVRRRIPQPAVLKERLEHVFQLFISEEHDDPITGLPLLNEDARKEFRSIIDDHVVKGCLSDPADVELYYESGQDSGSGLKRFRCIRGTNDVEGGFHQKLATNFKVPVLFLSFQH